MNLPNEHSIEKSVERLRRRSFLVSFVREEAKFLFVAFAAAALIAGGWIAVALWKGGQPATPPFALLGAGAFAIATIAAFFSAALRRPRFLEVAKAWDDYSGGKDRMSSALELHASEGTMATILREDAAREAARVEPKRVYPVRLPRLGLWIPVPLALFVLCAFLPGWLRAETPRNPHFDYTVAGQAAQIKDYVAREKGKELTKQRKDMLERLERLASDLTRDNMKKKDALAEIAKLMEQMKKDKNEEEAKKKELEKLLKSLQVNDKTKNLNEDMNNGNYDDAAKKVDEMIEKQNEELKKKREAGAKKEELKALEDKINDLEKIKAQLMKLKLSKYNINNMTEVLEFLEGFEGELGDLDDEIVDGEPCKNCKGGTCSRPKVGPIVRIARAPQQQQKGWGKGTVENIFGEETNNAHTREEHKINIREGKGKSAFTQTQVANDGSKSRLGAREILAAERRAAEDTIEQQDVPAGYREYIRKYFDGIQPETQEKGIAESAPAAGK